jgi:hypothetical protein
MGGWMDGWLYVPCPSLSIFYALFSKAEKSLGY